MVLVEDSGDLEPWREREDSDAPGSCSESGSHHALALAVLGVKGSRSSCACHGGLRLKSLDFKLSESSRKPKVPVAA